MELREYINHTTKYNKVLSLILDKTISRVLNKDVEAYFSLNLLKLNSKIVQENQINKIKQITAKKNTKNSRLIHKILNKRLVLRKQLSSKMKHIDNDILKVCKNIEKDIERQILKNSRLSNMKKYIDENFVFFHQTIKKLNDKELNVHKKMYSSCTRILELCDFLKTIEYENKDFLEKKKAKIIRENEFIKENHSSNIIAEKLIELSEEIVRFTKIYPRTLKIEPVLDRYDTKTIFKDYVLLAGIGGINIDIGLTNILNKLLKKVNKIRKSIHNIREINKKNINRILNNRAIFIEILFKYSKKNLSNEILKELRLKSLSIKSYTQLIEENNIVI